MKQNGAFLVRYSSKPTNEIPYTMCVAFDGRVLNSHIRLKSNGYYALGKEKGGEKTFSTISDLIRYHQEVPIEINPSGTKNLFRVCLLVT
ncbi:B-cell linker protein, partial [Stegodyphus mimosarum]